MDVWTTLRILRELYPKILFEYQRINQSETDGIITKQEALLLRQRKVPIE